MIEEEEDFGEIQDPSDVPLPSTESPGWTDVDVEYFGKGIPDHESVVSPSSGSSTRRNRSSSLSSRQNTPDRRRSVYNGVLQLRSSLSEDRGTCGFRAGQSPRQTGCGMLHISQEQPGSGFVPLQKPSHTPSWYQAPQPDHISSGPHSVPPKYQARSPNPDDPNGPGTGGDLPLRWLPGTWAMFISILWEQVAAGMRYCTQGRWYISFGLAIKVLASVLCSAGPICKGRSGYELMMTYASSSLWECLCILTVYTLMISGLIDSVEAMGKTLSKIGVRAAQQQELLFNDWKGFFSRPMAYCREYLSPICVDVIDEVLEPPLIMALTVALRDWSWFAFGLSAHGTPAMLGFVVSLNLHLVKWFCQACEIFWNLRGNIPGLSWLKKPLVFLLLVSLSMIAIYHNWELLSFSPMSNIRAAEAYWHSDKYPRTGNETTIRIAEWITRPTKEAAARGYSVTEVLVVSGVRPTMSKSG